MNWLSTFISLVSVVILSVCTLDGQSLSKLPSSFNTASHFPECEDPIQPKIKEVGATKVSVHWQEPRDAVGSYFYELRFRTIEEGLATSWQNLQVNRRMGVTVEGLMPGSLYELEMRRVCDEQMALRSDWVHVGEFMTLLRRADDSSNSDTCDLMSSIDLTKVPDSGILNITWDGPEAGDPPGIRYEVRYRATAYGNASPWVSEEVRQGNTFEFFEADLPPNAAVQFQIRMVWGGGNAAHGLRTCEWEDVGEISTSDAVEETEEDLPIELPSFTCGEDFTPANVPETPLLDSAGVGSVFTIRGFPVLVTELTGGAGTFSGKGTVPLPFGEQAVAVAFENIQVNDAHQIFSGSLHGIADDPANYPNLEPNLVTVGGEICQDIAEEAGFDENGIHSETGEIWDPNGFDQNGQYVKQPPYPGYSEGDPYDPNYDPNGFDSDGNHVVTGGPYNENGCDVNGFDENGQPCDNSGPSPYYWENENNSGGGQPTQEGIQLAAQYQDTLDLMIEAALNAYLVETQDSIAAVRTGCDNLRADMDNLMGTLGYQRAFVFGENDKYFAEGMSDEFASAPQELGVTLERNPDHIELENKHVELYECDVALAKYKCAETFLQDKLQPSELAALTDQLLDLIKAFSAEEASQRNEPEHMTHWIESQLMDELTASCDIDVPDGMGSLDLQQEFNRIHDDALLSPFSSSPLMASTSASTSSKLTKEDISFLYKQGFRYVGNVHRAYYMEAIAEERVINNLGSSGYKMPVVVSKEVAGKEQTIYLDDIVLTPTGASMDVYFVLDIPTSGDRLIFSAENVSFGPTGTDQESTLSLGTDISIRISNAARLKINGSGGTYVSWDCNGFAGMGIDGEVEFCRKYVKPIDPNTKEVIEGDQRVKAHFTTEMPAWGEFIVALDVDPFVVTKIEDVKWVVEDCILDFSPSDSPEGIAFPANYDSPYVSTAGNASPLWRGFYMSQLSATLPKKITGNDMQGESAAEKTIGVQHVIFDNRGFTGQAFVSDIMPLSDNQNLDGWAFSIDQFSISVVANSLVGIDFDGLINVPIFQSMQSNGGTDVTPGDCFQYNAEICTEGLYNFSVVPDSNATYKVPLWLAEAKINDNSSLTIQDQGNGFKIKAELSGEITINSDGQGGSNWGVSVPTLGFKGLTISNKSRYFSPGTWSFPGEIGANLGGFEVSVSNIRVLDTLMGVSNQAALDFSIGVQIAESKAGISANGSFRLIGELTETGGRQRWVYKELKLKELCVDGTPPGVEKLKGCLTFFDENDEGGAYGKGFQGILDVTFTGVEANLEAVALFGRMPAEDYKYFMVDALVTFDPGVPMAPGVNLNGFGGGMYYKMSRSGTPTLSQTAGGEDPQLPTQGIGTSLSGAEYTPDKNAGIGIMATVAICAQGNPAMFNANVTFGVTIRDNFDGVEEIYLRGNARFLEGQQIAALPSFDTSGVKPNNQAAVNAYVDIAYNFSAKTFDAVFDVYLNAGIVTGVGTGGLYANTTIHFGPDKWFINMGTPTNRNGMKVGAPVVGDVLTLESYLCAGTGIPAMPELPANVADITGAGNFMANESQRATGRGFAFGASIGFDTGDLSFAIFYSRFAADIGFDLMLQEYGDAFCEQSGEQIGINGWYASGQAWAYLEGTIGIKTKVWGSEKRFDIIDLAAGAALQMKLPNPFWARGAVGGRYRILGGLIKGNCNFEFTLGESCNIIGAENPAENLNVILTVTPQDGATRVSTNVQPSATFNVPVNEVFEMTGLDNEVDRYKAELVEAKIERLGENQGNIPVQLTVLPGNTGVTLKPYNMLPANDSFQVVLEVVIYENGQEVDTETRTHKFYTGDPLRTIPKGNILASYPLDGQYNFHKLEWSQQEAYIQLDVGQPDLFNNPPEGYRVQAKLTSSTGSRQYFPIRYNELERTVFIEKFGFTLSNEKFYKLEIVMRPPEDDDTGTVNNQAPPGGSSNYQNGPGSTYQPNADPPPADETEPPSASASLGPGNNSGNASSGSSPAENEEATAQPQTICELYFRTSQYDTFGEKLAAIEANYTEHQAEGHALMYSLGISEPFDAFELGTDQGVESLVDFSFDIAEVNWYYDQAKPILYDYFPGSVSMAGADRELLITRRPEELGLPPVNDVVNITQPADQEGQRVTFPMYVLGNISSSFAQEADEAAAGQLIENRFFAMVYKDLADLRIQLDSIDSNIRVHLMENENGAESEGGTSGSGIQVDVLATDIAIETYEGILPDWVKGYLAGRLNYIDDVPAYTELPEPPTGTYPVTARYKLPGTGQVTTVLPLDLSKTH